MIPYSWLFIGWIIFASIFALAALITLGTMMRYGKSCSATYLISGVFLLVSLSVITLTLSYAFSLDLSQGIDLSTLF